MLKIKSISKTYKTGGLIQKALDNVSLNLRDNEFVAILGPSGSGKTTLLNIIGGLDRYDEGDLIINNISTKKYKDRDWDSYRNHTIGFVFQSYNLIPHQTILSNVELALTISGVSYKERRQRALNALDEVGLKDQAHKKPNQMSGGQMQRVAIARALVNNPEILLADEPTGALDTKTSIQVMDLLRQVAKDRLVVMVTHNPELADTYATRIVRLQDGVITSDSNPFVVEDLKRKPEHKNLGKAKMSFMTALSLSFNNLLTKKGRTILTAFAGSIGIIGIALILSLSQGFQNYIDKIQEDTLSSYPLTITQESTDMTSMILSMTSEGGGEATGVLKEKQYMADMFAAVSMNDMGTLKTYIENNFDKIKDDVDSVSYSYAITPNIYTIDASDNLVCLNPNAMMSSFTSGSLSSLVTSAYSSYGIGIFTEMPEDQTMLENNYEVLSGRWPNNYDEMIIVLSEKDGISDLLVYSLGLRDFDELMDMFTKNMSGEEVTTRNEPMNVTFEDLLNLDLRLINPSNKYKYNEKYKIYEDMSNDDVYMQEKYDNALKLKIVGIVAHKEGASSTALSPGVAYSKDLTRYIIEDASKSQIVKQQLMNKDIDVFSGKSFTEKNKENEKGLEFDEMITIDEDILKDAFKVNISEDDFDVDTGAIQEAVMDSIEENYPLIVSATVNEGIAQAVSSLNASYYSISSSMLESLLTSGYTKELPLETMLSSATSTFTKTGYKAFAQQAANANAGLAAVISMFTDDDYTKLAEACKAQFTTYYTTLNNAQYGVVSLDYDSNSETPNENCIAVSKSGNIVTYGVNDSGVIPPTTTITSTEVYAASMLDATYLSSTKEVVNRIATETIKGVVSMVAMQASTDTATIVGDGISSLFSKDIMSVDTDKFAEAFKFDMSEDELQRIMTSMFSDTSIASAATNLINLGYQDIDEPSTISFYFSSFDAKENFLKFLDDYNKTLPEDQRVKYTDLTGILMSSVKTIVDSVSYVLIAFVSISLVVSSIMIAVITLISVMERTKEIGILRAMGASKRNVSSIFNAETFIIGLLSGLLGIGVTLSVIPPINQLIHNLTNNYNINAVLPKEAAIILILISVVLTMLAGLIPSSKAAKQDPVIALRSE